MPDRDSLQFAILGPLEVTAAGTPVTLGGAQRKVLMTVLLLEAGKAVPIPRLMEVIWGDSPPEKALRTHVSELRRVMADDKPPRVLLRKGAGYLLDGRAEQIDAERVRRLLAQGRRAVDDSDPVSAIAPLQEAQSLWRGPPLADVADHPFAHGYAAALSELQLDVAKTRIAADLSLGRHREVIGDLRMLVDRHPHDDGLRREMVVAFFRDGPDRERRPGLPGRPGGPARAWAGLPDAAPPAGGRATRGTEPRLGSAAIAGPPRPGRTRRFRQPPAATGRPGVHRAGHHPGPGARRAH